MVIKVFRSAQKLELTGFSFESFVASQLVTHVGGPLLLLSPPSVLGGILFIGGESMLDDGGIIGEHPGSLVDDVGAPALVMRVLIDVDEGQPPEV